MKARRRWFPMQRIVPLILHDLREKYNLDFPAPHKKSRERIFAPGFFQKLVLNDVDDDAGTNGTAAFTDSEAEAILDGDRGDKLDVHVDVIAGHAHLNAVGQRNDAGHVGGTEVELGSVVVEERSVTAAFFLGQDVNLASELGQRMDGISEREPN